MAPDRLSGKMKLAVLISGSGSNLQAILDASAKTDFPAQVDVVISNVPDAFGLTRAKQAGIPTISIDHREYPDRHSFENALQSALSTYEVDLICLAGFMRILTSEFIAQWPDKIINTHPALLPKFGGPGMYGNHVHKAVLAAGETQSGPTIHYVIPEVDKGEIIAQSRVDVKENDTAETLAKRVLEQEHVLYPEAIKLIAEKRGFKTT